MRSINALLKSVANVKGLMTAPIPTNKHKFMILEPDIFPNNKSVSSFLADIILSLFLVELFQPLQLSYL